jgi:hypothetical protein
VPVAFLGVPNTDPLAAAAVLLAPAVLDELELPELAELLQPAATSAATASAPAPSHLGRII